MNSYLPTKLDSLEEINVFLSAYSLPRLKQEEIDNLKKPNTSKEIDFVNKLKKKKKKRLPTNKSPRVDGFPREVYQPYKELIPTIIKALQKIEEDRTLSSSFQKATITLIHKIDKNTRKKLQANITEEYR